MAKLEVQIGADSSELKTEIARAEVELDKLRKQKSIDVKLGLDTVHLQKNINEAKAQLANLKKSVDNTGGAFGSMAPKVANGGNALMQFSRIAQDAPYGMIGIGNNITSTVEAFGHLKQSTGSAGGALKAMASSLMGSGGMLLAVSLVTTAFTYMSMNGISVGDVFRKLTGDVDSLAMTMNKMAADAAKNSGQEVANMNALVSVAQNDLLAKKDRLTAVEELQNQFPAYFGNLDKEKILTGDLSLVTKELTKAIIARAEASAIADKIGEIASKKLEAQIKLEKAISDKQKAQASANANEGGNNFSGVGVNTGGMMRSAVQGDLNNKINEEKELKKEIAGYDSQMLSLAGKQNIKTAESIKLYEKKASAVKKSDPVNFTPQVSSVGGLNASGLVDTTGIAVVTGQLDEFKNKITSLPGVITTSMGEMKTAFDTGGIALAEAMMQFEESFNDIVYNGIGNTLADLGYSIGDALASGKNVLQSAGKSLLSSMGAILVQLGELAIKTGVGILAVKMALKTLNPYVAIAAGIALVALGSAFSSKASSLGNTGGSGSSGGSVQGGNSYSSPSSSSSSGGGGFSGGTVVFEISGQSLIGVLSNAMDKNRRLGGTN